jgi:hypothetical protein
MDSSWLTTYRDPRSSGVDDGSQDVGCWMVANMCRYGVIVCVYVYICMYIWYICMYISTYQHM